MRHGLAAALLSLTLTGTAFAVDDPAEMLPDHRQELRAEAIGAQLRCLVCQNESIEDSRADLARDLRHIVRVHVARGETDRQVMDWMVARYGDFIRLRPRLAPMTLLLWSMPLLALTIGGLAAWIGLRRRPANQDVRELDPQERARLAELLH